MSEIEILSQFKKASILFIDELINTFPREADLVILRIMLKDQLPIVDLMNHFIHKVVPLKDMVTNRDEKFFTENDVLFGGLDKGKKGMFKKIWQSSELDDEDREVIWKWFESFILLSEKCALARATNLQK